MPIGTIDFYHYIPLHWPWPLLGITRLTQSKTCWFQFRAHLSIDQNEIRYGNEAIWPERPETILSEILVSRGKMLFHWLNLAILNRTCYRLVLRLGAYEPTSVKFCMMIDVAKFYVLIPVWMTWPPLKVTGFMKVEFESFDAFHVSFLSSIIVVASFHLTGTFVVSKIWLNIFVICLNYWTISLLSHMYKLFTRTLQKRMEKVLDENNSRE